MSKLELVDVFRLRTGKTIEDSQLSINTVFEIISDALEVGAEVKIMNFGTFYSGDYKGRKVIHPLSDKDNPVYCEVEPHRIVKFRGSKTFRDRL